jgi:hypothetical protein
MYFSTADAQLGRDARIVHPADVGLQVVVHLLPAVFLCVELIFTKVRATAFSNFFMRAYVLCCRKSATASL